jgi:hypothetical protein
LNQSSDPDVLAAAGLLDQLRDLRGKADYDVGNRTKRKFVSVDSQRAVLLPYQTITTLETSAQRDGRLFIPPGVT